MTSDRDRRTGRLGAAALALGTAVFLAVWGWAWTVLPPDGVAHHIGPGGIRTGSRAGILWPLLILGPPLMLAVRGLIVLVVRKGDGTGLNYPHKDYWLAPGRRAGFLRRLLGEFDLLWGATLVLMAVSVVEVVRATEDPAAPSVMPPALGAFVGFTRGCWWVLSRSRPPRAV